MFTLFIIPHTSIIYTSPLYKYTRHTRHLHCTDDSNLPSKTVQVPKIGPDHSVIKLHKYCLVKLVVEIRKHLQMVLILRWVLTSLCEILQIYILVWSPWGPLEDTWILVQNSRSPVTNTVHVVIQFIKYSFATVQFSKWPWRYLNGVGLGTWQCTGCMQPSVWNCLQLGIDQGSMLKQDDRPHQIGIDHNSK